MRITLTGGDRRQLLLATLLEERGHQVRRAFLGEGGPDALENAEAVVLPLPALKPGGTLNAPLEPGPVAAETVLARLSPGQRVLAGRPDDTLRKLASDRGLELEDYYGEALCVRNAAITAEGAAGLLLERLPVTLAGQRVLVLGAGRIGRLLALKLRGLGAAVTVSARREEDFAWLEALDLPALHTERLSGRLEGWRAVVNTVPATVLTGPLLAELPGSCLLMELASAPGGFDRAAAERLGLETAMAPGLPGKTAPESAARAILRALLPMLEDHKEDPWKS